MDSISRRSAINLLKKWSDGYQYIETETELAIKEFQELPSAQPERKKGKWIHHIDWESDGECAYECSVCGMGSDVDYDFCMRCGADMRGDTDETDS